MSKKDRTLGFDTEEMDKAIEHATKLGLGLAIVSKEALEGAIKQASKDSDVTEREARKAVDDLVTKSKAREKELRTKVTRAIRSVRTKSPVVTRNEVDKLKAEITKLKKLLSKKGKKSKKKRKR